MKSPIRWGADRWALAGLVLLGWALRLPAAIHEPFHPDEAVYGYWGLLIGRGRDLWLASVPVDKPPVLPYLMAGAQFLFGRSEFAVRLAGLAPGLLMGPLIAALAYALYRDWWTSLAAAIGVLLSPFAITFSSAAFPDSLMVALGLAACVAAAGDRPAWAGLLAGLSFATKQTGLAWLPLAFVLQATSSGRPKARASGGASDLKSRGAGSHGTSLGLRTQTVAVFLICLALVLGLVFGWDLLRAAQGADSFWRAGVTGYGGLRLIWPHELWPRLRAWANRIPSFFSSPVVNGALLAGLPLLIWRALRHRRAAPEAFADLVLVFFSVVYFLVHWLWAFPTWDRYLLPLAPVLAVLVARVISLAASLLRSITSVSHLPPRSWRSEARNGALFAVHFLLLVCLIGPALGAARNRHPLASDRAAYDGVDQVAAFLSRLPMGSVVYHHWLGWHYHYYLFDAPVYLAYWSTPSWLAGDVQAFGGREPRYAAFPSWESPARVERALREVDYRLKPVLTTTCRDGSPSFTLYSILGLSG